MPTDIHISIRVSLPNRLLSFHPHLFVLNLSPLCLIQSVFSFLLHLIVLLILPHFLCHAVFSFSAIASIVFLLFTDNSNFSSTLSPPHSSFHASFLLSNFLSIPCKLCFYRFLLSSYTILHLFFMSPFLFPVLAPLFSSSFSFFYVPT